MADENESPTFKAFKDCFQTCNMNPEQELIFKIGRLEEKLSKIRGFVFGGSIKEFLKNREVTKEELNIELEISRLEEELSRIPQPNDPVIGARG